MAGYAATAAALCSCSATDLECDARLAATVVIAACCRYTAAGSRNLCLKQCLQLPKPLWREVGPLPIILLGYACIVHAKPTHPLSLPVYLWSKRH